MFNSKKVNLRLYIGPKRLILLLPLLASSAILWHYYEAGLITPQTITNYRSSYPIYSLIILVGLYALFVFTSLPSLPLNLVAGFLYGGFIGGLISSFSVTMGSWLSFLVARKILGQPLTAKFNNQWVNMVQEEFNQHGWKFLAFARLNPIIPTGPLNYLLGLTSIKSFTFISVTFFFLLPPSILVAYMGDTFQTFAANDPSIQGVIKVILSISTIVSIFFAMKYLTHLIRKKKVRL